MRESVVKACLHCGQFMAKMKKCSKCEAELKLSSYYCSKNCQLLDWDRHKAIFHSKTPANYESEIIVVESNESGEYYHANLHGGKSADSKTSSVCGETQDHTEKVTQNTTDFAGSP